MTALIGNFVTKALKKPREAHDCTRRLLDIVTNDKCSVEDHANAIASLGVIGRWNAALRPQIRLTLKTLQSTASTPKTVQNMILTALTELDVKSPEPTLVPVLEETPTERREMDSFFEQWPTAVNSR